MIAKELEAQILRLHHVEKWPIGTIARQCGVHHGTVRRVLANEGIVAARQSSRPSIAEPYVPFIIETLAKYPELPASRLYGMVRERGYPGAPDHFRSVVALYRPRRAAEGYLRLRTLPGEQAQVDWAHFGRIRVGGCERPLVAFVMVLSWSRQVFLRFFMDMRMGSFLTGHIEAFQFFEGVPKVLLYDNLKSAVLERRGDAIRFNPTLLDFAAHYRFEPRPVAVARGNEKGRVERAIRYVRSSFFTARTVDDVAALNAQALSWCQHVAALRTSPEDRTQTVQQAWIQERSLLLPIPSDNYPAEDCVEVQVGKTPYVRFDSNDYSVPHDRVRRKLVVRATPEGVRIIEGDEIVATHKRCWDKHQQVEDPAHVEGLVDVKRNAREGRGVDRLQRAVPRSRDFLVCAAERGHSIGTAVAGLLRLVDSHGSVDVDTAIVEAMHSGAYHVAAVRQVLDRMRYERGLKPPVAVVLPDHKAAREVVVKPHNLSSYDRLRDGEDGSNER